MRAAAHVANGAVHRAMRSYANGYVTDEDDLTGALVGNLQADLSKPVGGLAWTASIVRHRRGVAAEERRVGADMVIHVKLNTPTDKYSKGVLVQAKRVDRFEIMSKKQHGELVEQCTRMLEVTPESFVFDYAQGSMKCGSAARVQGATSRELYDVCAWTSYRFFLELFRCPVGDPRLTSALVRDLPVPTVLEVSGTGELDGDLEPAQLMPTPYR